jgi:formylglycine-generating enzyme
MFAGGRMRPLVLAAFLGFGVLAATVVAHAQTLAPHQPGVFRDCAVCPEMVVIPAGSFTMGSPANETYRHYEEGPQRRIAFAHDFAVGRFEVTRGQYAAFARATGHAAGNGCYTDRVPEDPWTPDPKGTWRDPGFSQGEDHPVVCVSWEDAQAYVAWLNSRTRGGYRLLSEAEWEYAARAGTTSAYTWGSNVNQGCSYANGADASARADYPYWNTMKCSDGALYTARGGAYQSNAFGLFDMIGNVEEWTQDCHKSSLDAVPSNGAANEPDYCSTRVSRGGSWSWGGNPRVLRSASRGMLSPAYRSHDLGFRVARTLN